MTSNKISYFEHIFKHILHYTQFQKQKEVIFMLGVKKGATALVPHDDNWKYEYILAKTELQSIFGDNLIEIHHVGSTAVKGISAKPILDISITMKDTGLLSYSGMEAAGYEYCGEAGVPGRYFFVRRVNDDISTHHVHCYLEGNDNHNGVVLFCTFLNQNPEYAKQYDDLKVTLALKYPYDREAYGRGKTAFIEEIVKLAKTEKLKNTILQYENDFFDIKFCNSRESLENRLSINFIEYGSSGSVYDRENIINALIPLTENRQIEILQFDLTLLSDDVLLAHYISHHKNDNRYALRTSIWKIEDSQWKMYFHQGTPLSGKADEKRF